MFPVVKSRQEAKGGGGGISPEISTEWQAYTHSEHPLSQTAELLM